MPTLLKFPKGALADGLLAPFWGGGFPNIVGVVGSNHSQCWHNLDQDLCAGQSDLRACRCEHIQAYKTECPHPHPECS